MVLFNGAHKHVHVRYPEYFLMTMNLGLSAFAQNHSVVEVGGASEGHVVQVPYSHTAS